MSEKATSKYNKKNKFIKKNLYFYYFLDPTVKS